MSLGSFLRYSRLAYELGQMIHAPRSTVRQLQKVRLRSLLRHASRFSPFYQRKLRGIDLKRARIQDLPITTKAEINAQLDDVFTDRAIRSEALKRFCADERNLGRWFLGRYAVSHTSGSQGPPLWIVQDRSNLELLFAMMTARSSLARQPGWAEGLRRLLRPRRVAVVTFRRGFYPSGASLEFLPEIVGPYATILRLSSMQSDLVERLREFQPHAITSYASVLEALAFQSEALRLTELQQITNSSEQLTTRAQQRIEAAFGIRVTDHYGAGECLMLADSCTTVGGGLHVNADWVILEVVNDAGEPVPPETLGARILVTNLANRVQPFIRYEIGDRVAFSRVPCPCGNKLPRLRKIEGRSSELFWVEHQGRRQFLSGVLFHTAADALGSIREWQAVQTHVDRIEVRVELLADSTSTRAEVGPRLIAKLREFGVPPSVNLVVVPTPQLTVDPHTGKMRRMVRVSELSLPDHWAHAKVAF